MRKVIELYFSVMLKILCDKFFNTLFFIPDTRTNSKPNIMIFNINGYSIFTIA